MCFFRSSWKYEKKTILTSVRLQIWQNISWLHAKLFQIQLSLWRKNKNIVLLQRDKNKQFYYHPSIFPSYNYLLCLQTKTCCACFSSKFKYKKTDHRLRLVLDVKCHSDNPEPIQSWMATQLKLNCHRLKKSQTVENWKIVSIQRQNCTLKVNTILEKNKDLLPKQEKKVYSCKKQITTISKSH